MAKRRDSDTGDADQSLVIKIDRTTKVAAERVLLDTIKSARRNAQGARGSFIIAPTRTLKEGVTRTPLPAARDRETPSANSSSAQCRAYKRDGERCTALAIAGNYGFCGRHR